MPDPYLQTWFGRLDASLGKAKAASTGDPELEAILAAYLIVLISGAYEDCMEHLFSVRAGRPNDPELKNYVEERVDRYFRNPTYKRVKDELECFSANYANEFERRVDATARIALESIVTNKNSVSHGKPVNVTLGEVQGYYQRSTPILQVLEDILT